MELDYPRTDKTTQKPYTKRQQQERIRKQMGYKPKFWIDEPEIWSSGEHLWSIFWELDAARHGLEPISYTEINAYKAATGVLLNPMDTRCIKAMDNARIKTTKEVANG